jgi:hypothetical protein
MGTPASGPNGPHEEKSKTAQAGAGTTTNPPPDSVKSGPNGPHVAKQPVTADDSGPDGPHGG